KNREPFAFQALFQALFYSSIAMTITGTSSPASGGEHLISHTLDMIAARDGRKHDYHGRQVGVSSILMAALYERVISIDRPLFVNFPAKIDETFWGALSPVVEKEYQSKLSRMRSAAAFLSIPDNWRELQTLIGPTLVAAATLKNCLSQAGAAHRVQDLLDNGRSMQRKKFVETVEHANQMRQRFTILDLAIMLGIIPDELDSLVDTWVSE
ncbi:MAG: iron-containing alcohol dehydrogenase, partial [Desulfopila sp.]|nr:iron-containing alcohol dehydrogenase [Desulfopila sp.]